MRSLITAALLFSVVMIVGANPAFAQTETTVDFMPIIQGLMGLAVTVLATIGAWVARRFGAKLGVDIDAERGVILDNAIRRGIEYASNVAMAKMEGKLEIDFKSEVLKGAIDYVLDKVPDTLLHFNVTEKRLAEMVKARLGPPVTGIAPDAVSAGA